MLSYQPLAFLIDLDDTLYDERQFVLSGYRAVAIHVASQSTVSWSSAFDYLHYVFLKFGRSGAFDRLLAEFGLSTLDVRDLVRIYREHSPEISLYPGVQEVMVRLRKTAPLALVTDGAAMVQSRKVDALGVTGLVDAVVLCDEVGAPKPNVGGFEAAAMKLGVSIQDCVIIGDDPMHDIMAAKSLGIQAIRVQTGRFSEIATPHLAPPVLNLDQFTDLTRLFGSQIQ